MNKFFEYLAYGGILMALCLLGIVFYELNFPTSAVEFYNEPFPVDKDVYVAGEIVYITIDYCRFVASKAEVTTSLYGVFVVPVEAHDSSVPAGCSKAVTTRIIPQYTPPGVYYFQFSFDYPVNGLRTISHQARSEDFLVTNN